MFFTKQPGCTSHWCRQENSPICELPTETDLMAKACHYYHLKSAMNLTHKNRVFHYDTRGRIKSWNSGSVPIVVVNILKNPVNSYDSNSVIAVPISILGDEKWNLLFFCLLVIPSESPERIRVYYTSLKRYFQGGRNAVGIVRNGSELMEKFRKSVL